MSDKANLYDNAKIESFFRTLKVEEVHMFEYETFADVADRVTYFIEEVYNRKRLHSSYRVKVVINHYQNNCIYVKSYF